MCFVPFVPFISSPNSMLFFNVYVNLIFSDFKSMLLLHHFIRWLVLMIILLFYLYRRIFRSSYGKLA